MIMNNYEVIRYLTVHMQGFRRTGNNVLKVTATGFFAFLNINGVRKDIIITAKHFADEISRVVFMLHYKENGKLVTVPVTTKVKWIFSEDEDLAYCEFKPIEERFRKTTGRSVYAAALTQKDFLTEKQLNEINILDEVIRQENQAHITNFLYFQKAMLPLFQKILLKTEEDLLIFLPWEVSPVHPYF